MIDVLREKCGVYTTSAEKEVVRTIKEKECYVCLDYEEELKKFDERPNEILTNFELPDGNIIQLGTERFRGPECLFNPMQVELKLIVYRQCFTLRYSKVILTLGSVCVVILFLVEELPLPKDFLKG